MATQVGIPRGTRDFGPQEVARREYLLGVLRKNFALFGYQPIETPAMENIETLTGKYGDEGDQLLFKILNSRMYESKSKDEIRTTFHKSLEGNINSTVLTEKALRYDLTVPFARYVVQHRNEISFPFKRFQIQPVWRADKPQKGRYREFYQCDADVIGSDSLNNEIELVHLTDTVFAELGIPVLIKINNRKILTGIAEIAGVPGKITDITVAIDKLDKISADAVIAELKQKEIPDAAIDKIKPLFTLAGSVDEKIAFLRNYLSGSETGQKGVDELEYILKSVSAEGLKKATVEPDITLARGLNYYTGAIFEVKALAGELKVSICGGGRYDDLTGVFGWKGMSGVGISFGADRIYDVMNDLNLFPESVTAGSRLMFVNFGGDDEIFSRNLLNATRTAGIESELYPDAAKMAKQMKYANDKQIPYVVLIGSNERNTGDCQVKDMVSGEQHKVRIEGLVKFISEKLKN